MKCPTLEWLEDSTVAVDVETYFAEESEPIDPEEQKEYDVCFVCSGNTCRSPMAEAYYNYVKGNGERVAVSAGLSPRPGDPISPLAVAALREAGVEPTDENDYPSHVAREINDEIFLSCRKIVALTSQIAFLLMLHFPLYASQITTLGEDVADPFGGDLEEYIAALDQISSLLS